jgi:hypothetical protein
MSEQKTKFWNKNVVADKILDHNVVRNSKRFLISLTINGNSEQRWIDDKSISNRELVNKYLSDINQKEKNKKSFETGEMLDSLL